MNYRISDISKILNIPSSTLRYYDKEGLLPNLQKDTFGNRIFKEIDFEWVNTINCLKKTGMKIKEIKEFLILVQEGDSTIDQRLNLIKKQKVLVEKQIKDQYKTLEFLNYKTEFYEKAKELGTVKAVKTVNNPKPKIDFSIK